MTAPLESPAGAGLPSYQLSRDRNFRSMMFGFLLSTIGDAAYFIVLGWFVLSVTGSQFALGTTLTFASIPRIVFMLVGGVLSDRIDRKLILVVSLLVRGCTLGVFVVLLVFLHGHPHLWVVDTMAVLFGVIDAFFYPASFSIVPNAVPRAVLDRANSLVQTVQQLSTVMGPVLAAGLLWMHAYSGMFGTIAGVFAVSAAVLSLLRLSRPNSARTSPGSTPRRPVTMRSEIVDGLRYVVSVRVLVLLLLVSMTLSFLFMGPINIGVPVLVRSLGWSGSTYGGYEAGFGAGAVLGGVVVSLLRGFRKRFLWLGGIGALEGVGMAGIGFVHVAWVGMAMMGIMGLALTIVNIPFITYIQTIVPSDKLGRTMSLVTLMSAGLTPVSYTLSSFLLQETGLSVPRLLLICGGVGGVLFLSLYLSRTYREAESDPAWLAAARPAADASMDAPGGDPVLPR